MTKRKIEGVFVSIAVMRRLRTLCMFRLIKISLQDKIVHIYRFIGTDIL